MINKCQYKDILTHIKMRSTILCFNFTTSEQTASFPYPIQPDPTKEYEASLLSLQTNNTRLNITEKW